jgi:hypothetical protein
VTAAVSSADAAYAGVTLASVALLNADDDLVAVTVGPISAATTEAGGDATFQVVLGSAPTADVTLTFATDAADEGTTSSTTLTFTPGAYAVPQTVTVVGVNDDVDDGDQAFQIDFAAVTSADPTYAAIVVASVDATNLDDDTAGLALSGGPASTSEGGASAELTVVLTSEPVGDVVVTVATSDASEASIASTTEHTFTAADWDQPWTVTAAGVDDDVDDGDVGFQVTATAASVDGGYDGLTGVRDDLTNTDDDTSALVVSDVSGIVSETGLAGTFTVTLASEPTADVIIAVSTTTPSEAAIGPTTLTFTAADWDVAQVVTVTGQDDGVFDGDEPFSVSLDPAGSIDPIYLALDPVTVTGVNIEQATWTFGFTGAPETWVVPAGITQVSFQVSGAQGGANAPPINVNFGGTVSGQLSVTPGETLTLTVGGQALGIAGGFNGGGAGDAGGQGGGGASDIRSGGTALADRVVVGGGGGGAGYWSNLHVVGGVGGLLGGNGYREPADPGGLGAGQTGPGASGTCTSFNNPAMAGGLGIGGTPLGSNCGCEGYGGGGGYYGGAGSGNCRGGGGGSSYADPVRVLAVSYSSGTRVGNGQISLSVP